MSSTSATFSVNFSRKLLLAIALLSVFGFIAIGTAQPARAAGWVNVMWEDFIAGNGSAPNGGLWNRTNRWSQVNCEWNYYTPNNAFIWGNELVIKSNRTGAWVNRYWDNGAADGCPQGRWMPVIDSGHITTQNKFTVSVNSQVLFKGKFINAGGPVTGGNAEGIWPAVWLVNNACQPAAPCASGEWPPEIDFLEMKGQEPWNWYMTIHAGVWPQNWYSGGVNGAHDLTSHYHIFKLEWTNTYIDWWIKDDGQPDSAFQRMRRYDIPGGTNINSKPMQIIINQAVGGNFVGGNPEAAALPRETKIDWIGVWRWQ